MPDRADMWNLHLIYRLSHLQDRVDADVLGTVRALEGVTRVDVVPSSDASTHLAFSTCSANVVGAALAAKQCLHEAVDACNATGWWWERTVRLVDEPAVRQVGTSPREKHL